MRPLATLIAVFLALAGGGCTTAARFFGKEDMLVIRLRSTEQEPVSGVRIEVRGWLEHFLAMRSSEKLAEGVSDPAGYFSVRVPLHVGYRIRIGQLFDAKAGWLGFRDIEQKDLETNTPIEVWVQWRGSGGPPAKNEEPNKSPEPTPRLGVLRSFFGRAKSSGNLRSVAHL